MIQGQRTNQGGQMGGSAAQGNPNMQGGGQINQQDQVAMGMAAGGNNSGPQFNLPPQQLPQGTQQQQINMQQQIHQQMRSQLQHRLGQGMRIQGQQGMPVMMQQHVSGNRMPPVQQQQGITMTRNPTM